MSDDNPTIKVYFPIPTLPAGYFKDRYPDILDGSDWVRKLPEWERKAFAQYGLQHADHGRLGGVARAKTAVRIKGRFAPASASPEPPENVSVTENNRCYDG